MDEQLKIIEFYKKKFYFSYSSLNKLLFLPSAFYNHYILGQKEDKLDSYLVEGRVIHCLILEATKFKEQFIITPNKIPNGKSKQLIHTLYDIWKKENARNELELYKHEILLWLKENNLHQSLKEDSKRLEKILNYNNRNYFEYLIKSKNKTVIDVETYHKCKLISDKLNENFKIYNLIKPNVTSFDSIDVYNEHYLKIDLEDYKFGLKGIIDNLTINHETKEITINDLKTTNKSLNDFHETIEFYNYWMQAAIYYKLVKETFKNLKDYNIKFNFIVIDKYTLIYSFPVSSITMLYWQKRLLEQLEIANYHYLNKEYKLPYKFAKNQVIL